MRTPLVASFDEALNTCFSSALEDILGLPARNVIYQVLEKMGISRADVSLRFDDVVKVLADVFGECSRVIVHRAIVGLFREYSLSVNLTYQDSLRDRLTFLRVRVVEDHLVPRRGRERDYFFDNTRNNLADSPEMEAGKDIAWSGFYRLKRGVGRDTQQ